MTRARWKSVGDFRTLPQRSVAACFLPSHCVPCSGCSIDITFVVTLHSSLPSTVIQKNFGFHSVLIACSVLNDAFSWSLLPSMCPGVDGGLFLKQSCRDRGLSDMQQAKAFCSRAAFFQRLQHPHTFQSVFLVSNIKSLGFAVPRSSDRRHDRQSLVLNSSAHTHVLMRPRQVECPADSPSGASRVGWRWPWVCWMGGTSSETEAGRGTEGAFGCAMPVVGASAWVLDEFHEAVEGPVEATLLRAAKLLVTGKYVRTCDASVQVQCI